MILRPFWRGVLGLALASLVGATSAHAGTVRGTATTVPTSTGGGVRYPDAAYDAQNNVFLAVTGKSKVQGRFLAPSGSLLTGPYNGTFNLTSATGYQQAPRAHCSAGVCLVVWHEGDSGTIPTARVVSYTGGFLSAPAALGPKGSMWEMGAGIAYSPADQEFLVTWMGNYGSGNNIWIARVNLAGQVLGNLALTNTTAYEREPSVAFNSASGEFVVVHSGTTKVNGVETAYVAAQRVKDGVPVGAKIQLDSAKAAYISWAEYNSETQSVLAAWSRGGSKVYGRAISASGAIGSLLTLSTSYGAYDALDVSYNPVTKSFLLVTHGSTVEDVGIEISSSYAPSPAFTLTANGGTGNFNPRVATSTANGIWMAVTAKSFASLVSQYATGTAGSGGGGSTPNPVEVTALSASAAPPFETGSPVTFSAQASGGTGTLEYAFWLQDAVTAQWVLARPFSTSSTFTWTPQDIDAGTRSLQVWARTVGSSASYEAWRGYGPFTVTSPVPGIKSFTANRSFPVPAGVSITWTVDARGGTGPLEYKFQRYDVSTGNWAVVAEYSPSNTFTWTPQVAGTYLLQVWVRAIGSSAAWQTWAGSGNFVVAAGTPDVVSITSNVAFPVKPGTNVTWTVNAAADGPLEYQFWLYNNITGAWILARPYSGSNQFTWNAVAGNYGLQVWIRNDNSSAVYEDWQNTALFWVRNPANFQSITANVPFPAAKNTSITFHIQASSSAPIQYRYWLFNVGTGAWTAICGGYTSSSNCTWTSQPGMYRVQGWIRNQGSTAEYEDWGQTANFLITD